MVISSAVLLLSPLDAAAVGGRGVVSSTKATFIIQSSPLVDAGDEKPSTTAKRLTLRESEDVPAFRASKSERNSLYKKKRATET